MTNLSGETSPRVTITQHDDAAFEVVRELRDDAGREFVVVLLRHPAFAEPCEVKLPAAHFKAVAHALLSARVPLTQSQTDALATLLGPRSRTARAEAA